jgi:hypothetical protein
MLVSMHLWLWSSLLSLQVHFSRLANLGVLDSPAVNDCGQAGLAPAIWLNTVTNCTLRLGGAVGSEVNWSIDWASHSGGATGCTLIEEACKLGSIIMWAAYLPSHWVGSLTAMSSWLGLLVMCTVGWGCCLTTCLVGFSLNCVSGRL